jgi:hypothetical protein
MNGEIIVDSKRKKGSKFTVIFKAVPVPTERELKEKNITKDQALDKLIREEVSAEIEEIPDPELLSILSKEFIPKIEHLKANMFLDDIKLFAKNIENLGQQHNNRYLVNISKQLSDYSLTFRLDKLADTLNKIREYSQKF